MEEFSSKIRSIIAESGIKIQQLSKTSQVERTFLQKIIKGTRRPSDLKMLNRILDAMTLTKSQREELIMLYKMDLLGRENYLRIQAVKEFIEEFHNSTWNRDNILKIKYKYELEEINEITAINGKDELYWNIKAVLEGLVSEGVSKLRILMQPDNELYMKLFYMLSQLKEDIEIEHIMCLEKNIKNVESNIYNIDSIKNMLPFLINRKNYNINTFYDETSSRFNKFSVFPYMIIIENKVIAISADYSSGIIYNKKDVFDLYNKIYDDIKDASREFINRFYGMYDYAMFYYNMEKEKRFITHDFMEHPCFTWFLNEEIMFKYIKIPFETAGELLGLMKIRIDNFYEHLENGNSIDVFFTKEGIERFAKEGMIEEIDPSIYNSIEKEDRIKMLRALREFCESGKYKAKLINSSKIALDKDVVITAFDEDNIGVLYQGKKEEPVFFVINERSINNSIYLFLKSLTISEYLDEETDVLEYIDSVINSIL